MTIRNNPYIKRPSMAHSPRSEEAFKKKFALSKEGSNSLATWFLGPKAENIDWFKDMVCQALDSHAKARKDYAPDDPFYVTDAIRDSKAFQEGQQLMSRELAKLTGALEGSVPFYSYRWQGHMNWDTTLPSLLGFIATLPYNPNNVAAEASPVTTHLESIVGEDLCNMLGFLVPSDQERQNGAIAPWGHITCDGSVANLEAMWFARNIKFLPAAVAALITSEKLDGADNLSVKLPTGETRKLVELNFWELMNITADEAIRLSSRLVSECGVNEEYLSATLASYTIQDLGWLAFYSVSGRHSANRMPTILTPATAHYSWPKNAAILGIGDANRIPIHVGVDGRMDMDSLRNILEESLGKQRPILQVVAVLGTTEEGSVDSVDGIVALREEYRKKGLDFLIHVDAAWGGYFASLLIEGVAQAVNVEDTPMLGLSDYVDTQLRALPQVESITIDPHKAGYINYPAGALCYRNGAFRDVVTFTAPVVYHGGVDPTVGVYGVEGSKAGAAVAATWLSHRVIPTNQDGYGKLLGQANFNSKRWFAAITSMAKCDDSFEVIPFQRLPAEKDGLGAEAVQKQREWIAQEIVPLSNAELSKSPHKMAFLRELGSDLAITAYLFNFKSGAGFNTDTLKLNKLNDYIFTKLSQPKYDPEKVPDVPLFVTSSTFDPAIYGEAFVSAFRKRIGLVGDEHVPLSFLISTTMNPMMSNTQEGSYIPELINIFRQVVIQSIKELHYS